jgi:hypothetical protein
MYPLDIYCLVDFICLLYRCSMKRYTLNDLLIDLKTRNVGRRNKDVVNILEYFNTLSNITEMLRNFIKNSNNRYHIRETYRIIDNITKFQEKWFNSYTIWLQSFKLSKSYKVEAIEGRPYIYHHIQTYYGFILEITHDISKLNHEFEVFIENVSKYNIFKNFIRNVFKLD